MSESRVVLLLHRDDGLEAGAIFASELDSAGYQTHWDGQWKHCSQLQRQRLRREGAAEAWACAVLFTGPPPNTRLLRRAEAALTGNDRSRLIPVLLAPGMQSKDVPDWLGRDESPLDLRNAPDTREAARAFVGVLRGVAAPTEYAGASADASGGCTPASSEQPGGVAAPTGYADASRDTSGGGTPASSEQSEDSPQGPVRRRYAERLYTTDRHRLAGLRQWFAPLPNEPTIAALDSEKLRTRVPESLDPKVAQQLLAEAENLMERRDDRMGTAEAKATTLMGTVALAASLVIAGSGLILDSSKVGDPWRQLLMALVAVLLCFLLACGYVASRALLKVFLISRPQPRALVTWASRDDLNYLTRERTIDLFDRAGRNLYVADYKLAQVRVAYRWYRLAMAAFLVLGLALLSYVLFGEVPRDK